MGNEKGVYEVYKKRAERAGCGYVEYIASKENCAFHYHTFHNFDKINNDKEEIFANINSSLIQGEVRSFFLSSDVYVPLLDFVHLMEQAISLLSLK